MLVKGTLGFGESFVEGKWECQDIPAMIKLLLISNAVKRIGLNLPWATVIGGKLKQLLGGGEQENKYANEYENEWFFEFLDELNQYGPGVWTGTDDLNQAVRNKFALYGNKLALSVGDTVLDVGCGSGEFIKHLHDAHGIAGTGLTLLEAERRIAQENMGDRNVTITVADVMTYAPPERFHRITACGLLRMIKLAEYPRLMQKLDALLAPGGTLLVDTPVLHPTPISSKEAFARKYINADLNSPTFEYLARNLCERFVIDEVIDLTPDQIRTNQAWIANMDALIAGTDNEDRRRFFRVWKFYEAANIGAMLAGVGGYYAFVLKRAS